MKRMVYETRNEATTAAEREAFAVPRRVIDEHRRAFAVAFADDEPRCRACELPGSECACEPCGVFE